MNPESSPAWPPRDCEEIRLWLNGRLDGECTPAQETWLAAHLQQCRACSAEWAELEYTRLMFATSRLKEPSDFEREALLRGTGPRALQTAGWLLLGLGIAVLLVYGAYALIADHDLPVAMRAGLAVLGAGTLLLLWRFGLERLRLRRRDPYRDVLR